MDVGGTQELEDLLQSRQRRFHLLLSSGGVTFLSGNGPQAEDDQDPKEPDAEQDADEDIPGVGRDVVNVTELKVCEKVSSDSGPLVDGPKQSGVPGNVLFGRVGRNKGTLEIRRSLLSLSSFQLSTPARKVT